VASTEIKLKGAWYFLLLADNKNEGTVPIPEVTNALPRKATHACLKWDLHEVKSEKTSATKNR
jgi:hypothetical protein